MTDQLHPLHDKLRDAVAALPAGPARNALASLIRRHRPSHWRPQRSWVTCSECAVLAWPPPPDPTAMWSDVVYPCATACVVAEALGIEVPEWELAQVEASSRVEALIERSSLGTAEAVLLRQSVPDDVAARILERARKFHDEQPQEVPNG